MRIFTSFWKQIRSSCDVRFYAHHKHSFWKGVRYLYALSVVLSAILAIKTAVFVLLVFPHIDDALVVAGRALDEVYPPELRVTIESGSLSTNVGTPYAIDVPPSLRSYWKLEAGEVPHLIVIDPKASVESFSSYETLVLLTEKNFVVIDKDPEQGNEEALSFENFRVKPYDSIVDETIVVTKEKYDIVSTAIQSSFRYIKPVAGIALVLSVILGPFIVGAFSLLTSLLFLVFATVLLWVVSLLAGKKKYSYSHLYVLSLYGITLSAIYGYAQNLLGFYVPYASIIIFFGFMLLVIFHKKKA